MLSGQKRPFAAQFRMASRPTDPSVKAALYARVSTDDGRQTVENQVRQLRELALALGVLVVPAVPVVHHNKRSRVTVLSR
jgi:predicted site-specific integrase-resolvase